MLDEPVTTTDDGAAAPRLDAPPQVPPPSVTPVTPTPRLDGTGLDFLRSQVDALDAHQFFVVASPGRPLDAIEIGRDPEGTLVVRVPPRITGEALPVPTRATLVERGFASPAPDSAQAPWEHPVPTGESQAAIDLALTTLREVFGVELGDELDIAHGSHEAEWDARNRLQAIRDQIEPVLSELLGKPAEQDEDGDYLVPSGDIQVWVAPRVLPGAPVVLRVFAITNVGVDITPELGLFLARLNFGLMFGRFALDTDHGAVWFDETLLGEATTDDELRFTVDVVATTARQWDDKLKDMFGGTTHVDLRARPEAKPEPPSSKPGQAGYL